MTDQPTPAQVLLKLADFIDAARAWSNEKRKANPDLEVQQTYFRLHHHLQFNLGPATLRAQAAALAEREAEVERLRSLITEWVQAEDKLADADALDRHTVLSVPEYERVRAADARYRAAYLALKDEALTPTHCGPCVRR